MPSYTSTLAHLRPALSPTVVSLRLCVWRWRKLLFVVILGILGWSLGMGMGDGEAGGAGYHHTFAYAISTQQELLSQVFFGVDQTERNF